MALLKRRGATRGCRAPPPTALPLGFREQREAASRPTISAQAPAELPMPLARSRDPAARLLLPEPIAAAQSGTRGAIEPARPLPRLPRPWCPSLRPGGVEAGVSRWLPASPARSARRGQHASASQAARGPAHSGTLPGPGTEALRERSPAEADAGSRHGMRTPAPPGPPGTRVPVLPPAGSQASGPADDLRPPPSLDLLITPILQMKTQMKRRRMK